MPVVNPGIRRFLGSAIQRLFNSASFSAPLTHTLVPERGTGSPTFTRASTATVMGYGPTDNAVDGLKLLTVAANEARFVGARRLSEGVWSNTFADGSLIPAATNTGYLAEGARTNLCLQSNAFTTAPWANDLTSIAQNATGPDGGTTAWTLTDSIGAAALGVNQTFSALTASQHTLSFFVGKTSGTPSNYPTCIIFPTIGTSGMAGMTVDTTNGVATAWVSYTGFTMADGVSVAVEDYNNDFWRASITFTALALPHISVIYPAGTKSATYSTGPNDFTAQGSAVIYGAQLELGSFASSYIPTTTVAVQRNADVLTYPSAGNISTVTGWAYAEVTSNTVAGQQMDMIDLVASGNPFIPMLVNAGNNFALLDPSVSTREFNAAPTRPIATPVKFSSTWSASGTIGTFNGAAPPASQSYTTGAVTNPICVGIRADGSQSIFGTIRNVRISQRQLSASEQQAITS